MSNEISEKAGYKFSNGIGLDRAKAITPINRR